MLYCEEHIAHNEVRLADTENGADNGLLGDWSPPEDIEALYREEQERLAAESGDGNRDDSDADQTPSSTKAEPKLTDEQQKLVDAVIAKREADLAAAIASGDQNNGVYKGLQRHLSQRDQQVAELRKMAEESQARYDALLSQMEELASGNEFTTETLLEALTPEAKAAAQNNLAERKRQRDQKRTDEELKRLREAATRPPSQPAPQAQDDQPVFTPDFIEQRLRQFRESQRTLATEAGLDPDDPNLDYGSDDDAIVERSEKFNRSLLKAMREKEVDNVRQKSPPALTRSSGGSNSPATATGSRLDKGADALWREMAKVSG